MPSTTSINRTTCTKLFSKHCIFSSKESSLFVPSTTSINRTIPIMFLHIAMEVLDNNIQEKVQQQQPKKLSPEELVQEIVTKIGYEFKDAALLLQAFTHESMNWKEDKEKEKVPTYERLEYIGDAFLNFMTAKDHFYMYPNQNPGDLTKLRSANVDAEKLARIAVKLELDKLLINRIDGFAEKVETFKEELKEYELHSWGQIDTPKILSDIVESLIGAILVDSESIDTTWKIVKKEVMKPLITPENIEPHPVTKLHEYCQKNNLRVEVNDENWNVTQEVIILCGEIVIGRGKYHNKTTAKNRSADQAYRYLTSVPACQESQSQNIVMTTCEFKGGTSCSVLNC